MAASISYQLTTSGNPQLVNYLEDGVPTRLLFAESEADEELWAEYQAFLSNGGIPKQPPEPRTYTPATIEQKLGSIGLTVDSLKTVLGLN